MYHPNIDLEGNICLNILREDWKPVLSINSVIYGLSFLFIVRDRTAMTGFRHPVRLIAPQCSAPALSIALP